MPADQFDDIRPYRDHEVAQVIKRLIQEERLAKVIEQYRHPWLYRNLPKTLQPVVRSVIRRRLHKRLDAVQTVDQVQSTVVHLVEGMIKKSMSGFSFNGIDQLDPEKPYLFLSNHRDIAMDPALVNYVLYLSKRPFVEIAIGDNLLSDPLVSDIMRLNRSFTVHRSVEGMKAKLKAFSRLSGYIHQTLGSGRSIWLAQREGRAKTGIDRTDPAIVKMLYLHGKKQGWSFAKTMQQLNIVPVAISYEYDPCDVMKAEELSARTNAGYQKKKGEDIASIIRGISCPKGRVHVGFGQELKADYSSPEEVASVVDLQVAEQTKLFPSNIAAFEQLKQLSDKLSAWQDKSLSKLDDWANQAKNQWLSIDPVDFSRQTALFKQRVAGSPDKLRKFILEMYANPLINQQSEMLK